MKKRLIRILGFGMLIVLAGVLYGVFVKSTGIAIPCIFRLITGLQCPGCGVTHMCVALLQLDIKGAFYSHPMLFLQMPVLLLIAVKNIIVYVRQGKYRLNTLETSVIYVCIGLLIGFTVYRNVVS